MSGNLKQTATFFVDEFIVEGPSDDRDTTIAPILHIFPGRVEDARGAVRGRPPFPEGIATLRGKIETSALGYS